FFQAEDGIRDATVTGVQTCALPISISAVLISKEQGCLQRSLWTACELPRWKPCRSSYGRIIGKDNSRASSPELSEIRRRNILMRSEERRVGKERRTGAVSCIEKKRS